MDCSVAQCLEVIGEWWSMLIVRDCFLGVTRFEDFQRRLGISRNILQQRLTGRVEHGGLERRRYSEHPPRHDYRLTTKGRDLWPVLTTMRQWGDKYAAPSGPPVVLVHRSCGRETTAVLSCTECGEGLNLFDCDVRDGIGRGGTAPSALFRESRHREA